MVHVLEHIKLVSRLTRLDSVDLLQRNPIESSWRPEANVKNKK